MTKQLNREIKAFCPDFAPVKEALRKHGAEFTEAGEQVDYYYNLPDLPSEDSNRRLKIREENGTAQVVYYVEGQEFGARTSRFQIWGLSGAQTKDMLDAVLGVRAVVRKQREVWRKDNVKFNLDQVEKIGQIVEVEILSDDGFDAETQLEQYRQLLGPYLGDPIVGSNEDMVPL